MLHGVKVILRRISHRVKKNRLNFCEKRVSCLRAMEYGLILLGSYLVGSVPFGYLAGKMHGVDLRECGSHNIGATNAGRVLGKKWGLIVFLADFLKGFLPVLLMICLLGGNPIEMETGQAGWLLGAIFAVVLGHTYTCFLGFKGGKGVATSAGALFALSPVIGVYAIVTWLSVMLAFRYVSLASIAAAVVMVIVAWYEFCGDGTTTVAGKMFFCLLAVLALLVIVKHRTNIVRLFNGTESKSWVRSKNK